MVLQPSDLCVNTSTWNYRMEVFIHASTHWGWDKMANINLIWVFWIEHPGYLGTHRMSPFSINGWERSEPIRKDIIYVTTPLIGSDLAYPENPNDHRSQTYSPHIVWVAASAWSEVWPWFPGAVLMDQGFDQAKTTRCISCQRSLAWNRSHQKLTKMVESHTKWN